MKVCIVGGTGNISTSIVKLLLDHGHNVTCFNRGKSGQVPEGVETIIGDRHNRTEFEETMQKHKFDAAIDMICFDREDAESDLKAFRGVSHFIHTSTVCTYGIDYDWLPATEDHPLHPITDYARNKVAADDVFLQAWHAERFPITIIKPSTTFGPIQGLLRQIAWDYSWLDRVVNGRPILICGNGMAIHQFLHVDDAALCFANVLGREKCLGQTYNMTKRGFCTWKEYHEIAMNVIGKKVDMLGICVNELDKFNVPEHDICVEIFAHNCYYSPEKLFRDVPEFSPKISLADSIKQVFEVWQQEKRIPKSEIGGWEDVIIDKISKHYH